MIDHDLQVFLCGEGNEFFGLCGIAGKRLFHEDMFAILQGGLGEFVVRPHRSHDGDRVDVRRLHQFICIVGDA